MEIEEITVKVGWKVSDEDFFVEVGYSEEEGVIRVDSNISFFRSELSDSGMEELLQLSDKEFDFVVASLAKLRTAYVNI